MKIKKIVAITMAVTMVVSVPSFAGSWQQNTIGWWWQNDDGSWPSGSWQWLDGNQDGIAECYYFNQDGYMLAGTTTPDNYTVDGNGAWTVGGVVQTQGTAVIGSLGEADGYDEDAAMSLFNMINQERIDRGLSPFPYSAGVHYVAQLMAKAWDDGELRYGNYLTFTGSHKAELGIAEDSDYYADFVHSGNSSSFTAEQFFASWQSLGLDEMQRGITVGNQWLDIFTDTAGINFCGVAFYHNPDDASGAYHVIVLFGDRDR